MDINNKTRVKRMEASLDSLSPEEAKAARERVEQKIKQNAWTGAMSGPADFKGLRRDELPIIASTDQKS